MQVAKEINATKGATVGNPRVIASTWVQCSMIACREHLEVSDDNHCSQISERIKFSADTLELHMFPYEEIRDSLATLFNHSKKGGGFRGCFLGRF